MRGFERTDGEYSERVERELVELEARLERLEEIDGGRVSGADVYFLKNVVVLVECALLDFGVHDTDQCHRNHTFDRNCMLEEKETVKVKSWVADLSIQRVDKFH